MHPSQDLPLNNRYHERDGVARALDERDVGARNLNAERHPPSKRIGMATERIGKATQRRPSISRRMFRALSRFSIAVLFGVAATLAWQSHGDEAKEMFRTWAPSLAWLLPVSTTTSSAPSAASSPELAQQLEPMARDLAIVRRSLEQLAANIATLHAVENPSSRTPSWAAPILPRTPPQPAAKASAVQSSPVSPPPARQPLVLR
jgi:hypothetical protein